MSSGHRGGPFEISSPILTYCKLGVHSLCVPQLMPRQHHRSEFPFSVFARRVMYTRAPPNARSSHSNRMAIGVLASFGMGSLSKHHSFLSRFARGIQSVDTVFPKVCRVDSYPLASSGQAFAGNPA